MSELMLLFFVKEKVVVLTTLMSVEDCISMIGELVLRRMAQMRGDVVDVYNVDV
jgi:hypothetical protein